MPTRPAPHGFEVVRTGQVGRVRALFDRAHVVTVDDELLAHPLLVGLRRSELRRWARAGDEVAFEPGQLVLQEDRIGHWFVLVHSGNAVKKRRGRLVGEVGPGSYVGEIAILGLGPQPTTVVARTHMRAFVVSRRHLVTLAADMPAVQLRFFPEMAPGEYQAKLRALRAAATAEWQEVAKSRRRRARAVGRSGPWPLTEVRPGRPPIRPSAVGAPLARAVRAARQPVSSIAELHRRLPWRTRLTIAAGAAGAVLAFGALYHPPIVVARPAAPIDVAADINVTGAAVHPVHGRYLLLTVSLYRPNAFGALLALATNRRHLPAGHSSSADEARAAWRRDEDVFRRSQRAAAAAAAVATGFDVHLSGTGATVTDVGGLGSGDVRAGDVIVAIDGRAVRTSSDAVRLLAARPPGVSVRLTIDRDIERLDVDANAPSLERDRARFPSVLTTRDPTFRLPFRVTFRHRALGGPSGGLVYALALADMLDGADHAGGRTVAATGAIEPGGGVTPVGFLPEKARAARRAHADLLLVPLSQIVDASSISGPGLAGTVSLDDARRALDRNSPRRARPRR